MPPAADRWPPPYYARAPLRNARRRYRRMAVTRRPALAVPSSAVGLFTAAELVALAKCGFWPLPERARAWLAAPAREARPAAEDVIRRVMAEELPALRKLIFQRRP